MNVQLLIPAAGKGLRLGARPPVARPPGARRPGDVGPKALVDLGGQPMLIRTLKRFQPLGLLENAIIIVSPEDGDKVQNAVRKVFPDTSFSYVLGGAERQLSVANGLNALEPATEIVVIHDAARPFVSPESVKASIEAAAEHGAATVAIPSADTILVGDEQAFLQETPDRRRLWACQTPQAFRVAVIREAHAAARRDGFVGTDDASLVRRLGQPVKLVMGTPLNFKVTTPGDRALAECVLKGELL